ncbi:glycosyltransferase [Methylobacterium sp. NEAU K]|uniref:glycosyltransferase n=1 Tax=Methylobacterium sp. NEAU K TaxID=3064946 RepID=UPI002736F7E8|nr:glycosyltransferase [Methylobacterium sp. NEAU K]MDP4005841.1 glycosyltransferase [Methylobacterium sp. NEAU K]
MMATVASGVRHDGAEGETARRPGRIRMNFDAFDTRVRHAERLAAAGDDAAAAVETAIAATLAAHRHCGVFASPRLERLMAEVGRRLEPPTDDRPAADPAPFRRVLHVCTQLAPVGGLTKMLALWINADHHRINGVALTQHRGPVDARITEAVRGSGGAIHHLNHRQGGKLAWARELRRVARDYDVVVLHIHCEDVIPLIAFADPAKHPPVLILNHADHLFWIGTRISHGVINLREAARRLAITRRGVEPARSFLLPTLITLPERQRSRSAAKQALGVPDDCVLLVSVARGAKYRNVGPVTYADRHVDLLAAHPNARLIVVGPGERADWAPAQAATDGRIIAYPEQSDPRIFFEAADIYVDSYPFVSSTSMLEAAAYGLPLVTRFEAPEAAEIVAINHPGLDATAHVAHDQSAYEAHLTALIADAPARRAAGAETAAAIARLYAPAAWLAGLDAVYAQARALPRLASDAADPVPAEAPHLGEPDLRHQDMFGSDFPVSGMTKNYIGMLPLRQRIASWAALRSAGHFSGPWERVRLLLPEWLVRNVKDRSGLLRTGSI